MADLLLNLGEEYLLAPFVYPASWATSFPREHWLRECLSLYIITNIGAYLMYFSLSGFSYMFMFDKSVLNHKLLLPNQVRREIIYTCKSIPTMALLTTAVFMAEVKGYSRLYERVSDHPWGWGYIAFSLLLFLFITDMLIYFIHRGLHDVKFLYKYVHKPHHEWKVTTPFASHAFHPVDGFLQGLPYHLFVFLFPLHKILYLFLFVIVNIWTVSIHDCNYMVPDSLSTIINSAGHHTVHHSKFNYNYGQYFTLWDRIGGSYLQPTEKDLSVETDSNSVSNNKKSK